MGSKHSVTTCRKSDEFCREARRQGAIVTEGHRHSKIEVPGRGTVPVPRHPGELSPAMRKVISKELILIGLTVLTLACIVARIVS